MAAPQPASPQRSRGFSVKSQESQNSGKSAKGHTRGFSESSEEKARRNLHTKADPLVAMNELQPSTLLGICLPVASPSIFSSTNIKNSGGCAGKIQFGLAARCPAQGSIWKYHQFVSTGIPRAFLRAFLLTLASADPDLSNPTRPRLERPLDTIRSFEAAIYGAYSNNRGSYARTGIITLSYIFSKQKGELKLIDLVRRCRITDGRFQPPDKLLRRYVSRHFFHRFILMSFSSRSKRQR
jgi:hypothetical protein